MILGTNSMWGQPPRLSTNANGNTVLVGADGTRYPLQEHNIVSLPDVYASDVTRTITVPNPYQVGDLSIVHAKIVCAPSGFGGYKYWLTATPFNNGETQYENPCIWASNDLNNWSTPVTNPLIPVPGTGFNSDPSLTFSPDGATLYLIYRENPTGVHNIRVLHTTDGRSWSSPVTILTGTTAAVTDFGSPSLVWNKASLKWEVYSLNFEAADPNPFQRNISTSSDVYGGFGATTTLTVPVTSGLTGWHADFIRDESNTLFGVFTEIPYSPSTDSQKQFYLVSSVDGTLFTKHALSIPLRAYRPAIYTDEFGDVKMLASYVDRGESFYIADLITQSDYAVIQAKRENQLNGSQFSLVRDTFTRADSATTMGSTENGLTWEYHTADTAGILGNRAYNSAGNANVSVNTGSADGYIEMDIAQIGSGNTMLIIRNTGAANGGTYVLVGLVANTTTRIYYQVYTGFTLTTDANINQPIDMTGHKLGVRFEGENYTFYIDGCKIGEAVIPDHLTGTRHGLKLNGATPAIINSFLFLPLSAM